MVGKIKGHGDSAWHLITLKQMLGTAITMIIISLSAITGIAPDGTWVCIAGRECLSELNIT